MSQNQQHKKNIPNEDEESILDSLDFIKFLIVAQKNLIWIILITIISLTSAFIYLRYTKQIFESSSIIKIEKKEETNMVLNMKFGDDNESKIISGEIEILKSRSFFEKVAKKLNIDVTVYAYGSINFTERYKENPFDIKYVILDKSKFDTPYDIEKIDDNHFYLSRTNNPQNKSKHKFGEQISDEGLILIINKSKFYFRDSSTSKYFFTINSDGKQVSDLMAGFEVSVLNLDAKTLKLIYKDYNELKAKDIISTIDSLYQIESLFKKIQAQEQSIQFLRNQLESTEDKLQEFEIKLEGFTKQTRLFDVKQEFGKNITKNEEFEKIIFDLKSEIDQYDELSQIIIGNKDLQSQIVFLGNLENEQLSSQLVLLNKAQIESKQILNTNKEGTYLFNSKKLEIENLKSNILNTILFSKKSLTEKLVNLNKKVLESENKFNYLPSKETELTRLKRLYNVYEKFYLTLLEKESEYGITKAGLVPEITILSEPQITNKPIYPVKNIVYLTALAIAFIFSFILLVIKYFLHNTINNQGELEKGTIAPVVGVVPKYKKEKMEVSRLVVDKNPKSPLSEALRSIRTNLEFLAKDNKTKRIISVTSTISGEGKTFVAINLSGIIAQSGLKVIIIDLDMRKPKIHRAFDTENEFGMSTILIGKSPINQCIHKTSIENLDFISAGPTPPNPSELILRSEFDKTIKELHEIYDIIFIDTPPVGLVTDGIIIMKKVDQPLYVVRAEYSKKGFEKNINKLITNNNFTNLGAILNGFDNAMGYGYGYKYGYGYSYGYGNGYYSEETQKSILNKILAFFRLS